jgi:hypothetical protein
MREAPNATLKTQQVLLTGGTWTLVLPTNVQRTYLVIQNHHDAHEIEVGFSTDTTPPASATGFKIEGAVTGNKIGDTTFEFAVAPINAVWARSDDAHDHPIDIMYDD